MLNELQDPLQQFEISFAELDESDYNVAQIGKRVRILQTELGTQVDTYVTELTYKYDDVPSSKIIVANKSTDIASSVADMADRQRIEQAYAQGATQLYSQSLQANCDSQNGAVMDFYLPEDMRIVNKIVAKVRVGSFRAYSKATKAAESKVVSLDDCFAKDLFKHLGRRLYLDHLFGWRPDVGRDDARVLKRLAEPNKWAGRAQSWSFRRAARDDQ